MTPEFQTAEPAMAGNPVGADSLEARAVKSMLTLATAAIDEWSVFCEDRELVDMVNSARDQITAMFDTLENAIQRGVDAAVLRAEIVFPIRRLIEKFLSFDRLKQMNQFEQVLVAPANEELPPAAAVAA